MQVRLKGIKEYNGKTNDDMAELIGVHPDTYKRKENGYLQFKSDEMFKIAKFFNMTLDDLFTAPKFTPREDEGKCTSNCTSNGKKQK